MDIDLKGRRIVVTGSSSGIGRAIATACVDAGAKVVCIARSEDKLREVCAEIGAIPVVVDITDESAIHAAVEYAAGELGGIDCLINNAGAMLHSRISQGRSDDWRVMLDTNILSVLLMSSAVIPHLRQAQRGDIVNISSTSAVRVAAPEYALYSATKAAVNMITIGLRQELAEFGIRVSAVAPGLVANTGFGPGIRDEVLREQVMSMKDERGIKPSVVATLVCNIIGLPVEARINDICVVPAWQTV